MPENDESPFPCECAECGKDIESYDVSESAYCGSVHADCWSGHLEHCSICDEDGEYDHDDEEDNDG